MQRFFPLLHERSCKSFNLFSYTQTLKWNSKQFNLTQTLHYLNIQFKHTRAQSYSKTAYSSNGSQTHLTISQFNDTERLCPSASTFACNTRLRTSTPRHALSLYSQMLRFPATLPNKFTFTFLLKSCLKNSASHFVKHLHCHLTLFGLASDPFLQTALISLYSDAGFVDTARHVFEKMPYRDVVAYTALVSAYASCGLADAARRVFDEMPERNAVSWGAVIAAYSQSGRHAEALDLFRSMQRVSGVDPTEATLVSVLSSSAHVGALEEGNWVHRYMSCNNIHLTASLGTALLSMYAKCGCLESAMEVFDAMPRKDAAAWTAMILALATHGQGEQALDLYNEMLDLGFIPDHITFIGVLAACSHAGFLDAGRYHFTCMKDFYGIAPGVEHYGCMVDMLGRAGHIEEVWNLVQTMPMEPDTFVLKSFLSACSNYGYVCFAEWAFSKLTALDVSNSSSYVMLANAYASICQWADVERVRKMMRDRGIEKMPGCSLIEFDGVVRQFVAGENYYHPD